jgi:hypothetical protein
MPHVAACTASGTGAISPDMSTHAIAPLITFNPVVSLTGAQRRTIVDLSGCRDGWHYTVTPSTGPAESVRLYDPDGVFYDIDRDGSWS